MNFQRVVGRISILMSIKGEDLSKLFFFVVILTKEEKIKFFMNLFHYRYRILVWFNK